MAPWAQEITVGGDRAVYEVWMNRITYVFDHQPTAERLDLLYDELRLGRFGDYDVIPFDEDEQPLDEGGRAWSASFGEFHHRFGDRNGTIDSPDTGFSPLVMLQAFVDQDQVPEATDRLTLVFESQSSPPDGLRITFDLGEAAFAMGEERWADEFVISWSGGPREVPVTVHAGPLGGRELVSEAVVEFVAGGRVRVVVDPDGQATVAAG